jgi:anti-anti-sigma factor
MTSLLIPAGPQTPACGLPVARTADPDECETLLLVEADERGDTAVVRARGEIDMLTVAQLRSALEAWLAAGVGTVVADLEGVTFVDCTGIGVLVQARRQARRRGVVLRILPGRAVARVAALLDLSATLGLPGAA